MYFVSRMQKDGWIEASLGGRVTQGEMAVFVEELSRATLNCAPGYSLYLDLSRVQPLEPELQAELNIVKEHILANGARRIAHAVRHEDIVRHIAERLDVVMAGREAYGLDETIMEPLPVPIGAAEQTIAA